MALRILLFVGVAATCEASSAGEADGALTIREFRVRGASLLPTIEIQQILYPYLGPARSPDDIETARSRLESEFHAAGYQTVRVEIPPQQVRRGTVVLFVHEVEIGKLRVRNARYSDPQRILAHAQSLREGSVPDFHAVLQDLVAMNQSSLRRVYPEVKPGLRENTIDVDLMVEDRLALAANAELNNRYSSGTSKLRFNAGVRYDDLWQRGHSIGFNVQLAPEEMDEVFVLSGNYSAKLGGIHSSWRWQLQGNIQDTNIASLGGITVAGIGETLGLRLVYSPRNTGASFHSLLFGIDYRRNRQNVLFADEEADAIETPLRYFPLQAIYSWIRPAETHLTEFTSIVTLHLRGVGSDSTDWMNSRYGADAAFVTLRTDLARTQNLAAGLKLYTRLQGQLASGPLVSNHQFAIGGLDTVRGYLEGEALGDNGAVLNIELRGAEFSGLWPASSSFWLHGFYDAGTVRLRSPLPGQRGREDLSSAGFGLRFRMVDRVHGSLDFAFPLKATRESAAGEAHLIFVIRGEI